MSKRLTAISDCLEFERFTGCAYCERRNLLAYASTKSEGVILKDLSSGAETRVSVTGQGEGAPRFSPDGKVMYFLSRLPGESSQLHGYDLETGAIRQISRFSGPISEPMVSPNGKSILFASSQGSAPGKKSRKDEPVVIEDFGYKFDGIGYIRPDGHTHLFLLDVETGDVRPLTEGVHDELHHTWSPDGQWIAYAGNEQRSREESIGYDLFVLNVATGEKRMISGGLWIVSYPNPIRPVFTPDSASVVMGCMNPAADTSLGYPDIVFFQFPISGEGAKCIFEKSDDCHQCVQFPYNAHCSWGMDKVQVTPDGKFVYFVSGFNGAGNLYKLPLTGEAAHAVPVLCGKHVIHGLSSIQNGKMIVAMAKTNQPEAYCLLDTENDEIVCKAAQSAQALTDEVELIDAEDFCFDTLDGEGRVHGWVMPPAAREDGKRYPCILYVHGGPHPFYTYGPTMEFQMLAAQGFGVLYCNPRGSSSYGPQHQNLKRAYDGSAYTDCLQFVDECVRRFDWIDPDRLGVTGGSYGGYMTNYIAAHAKRFKAYVSQRSVASELIGYASSDMQGSSKDYASFEEFMVAKLKESTVAYAERIDRPLLILHGEDDYRTPVEGAHQLFVAVKDTHPDLPVKLIVYPHTHHDQPQHPRMLAHYYQEMIGWFRQYL